jgi:hypothetical protein
MYPKEDLMKAPMTWNDFGTFLNGFAFAGGVAADRTDDAAVEIEAVGGTTDALEDMP